MVMASPRRPPSPAGSASSMVLISDVLPSLTRTIFRVSRSLMRKLPSLSGTKPQGATRSETTSRARGSPCVLTVLGDGLLGFGLLEPGLDSGDEVAGVGPAVRVSGLGSLGGLVQPVTRSSAPQAASRHERLPRCVKRGRLPRCLAGTGGWFTSTVSCAQARQLSRPKVRGGQDFDRMRR